jgi:hypothetical protein
MQELERLRIELANAASLLDELERRRKTREQQPAAADLLINSDIYPKEAETRFAACVSQGLAKLSSK